MRRGTPVTAGEKEKTETYEHRCKFPSNVRLLPCTIDTHGRWGAQFAQYLGDYCQRAAGNDTKLYNFLITRARNTVSVALAKGVGELVRDALKRCVNEADDGRLVEIYRVLSR